LKPAGYHGKIVKGAEVKTNDPENKNFKLALRAFVKEWITLSNEHVYLSGAADETHTASIEINAKGEEPLQLTLKDFSLDDKLRYEIEELEEGRKFRVRFTTAPGAPDTYQGFLRLKTNYPLKPVVNIPINARLHEREIIKLSQRYLYLHGTVGQSITKQVDIEAGIDAPLRLTLKEFTVAEAVKYSLEEIEKGRKFRLKFANLPGGAETFSGFLKLETSYVQKPEITIYLRGRFRNKK
jgi:uncharacterized membrane protein